MRRTLCPDTSDGLSGTGAADTLSLFRECPSACPSAGQGKEQGLRAGSMTIEQARHEFARLTSELPALASAAETSSAALEAEQARVDSLDPEAWHGRVCGALQGALEGLRAAESMHRRAMNALGACHRKRAELLKLLREDAVSGVRD